MLEDVARDMTTRFDHKMGGELTAMTLRPWTLPLVYQRNSGQFLLPLEKSTARERISTATVSTPFRLSRGRRSLCEFFK